MAATFYKVLAFFKFMHPMHPVIVNMLIGPIILAAILQVVGMVFKRPVLFRTARHLTVLAFIFWFPSVLVGVIDWTYFYGASPQMTEIWYKSMGAGLLFVILLTTLLVFRKAKENSRIVLILYLLAAADVSMVGVFGGDIVFSGKAPEPNTTETSMTADGYKQFEVGGFTVGWKISDGKISVRESYETTGWIGIGFGPGTMKDSHIILGYVGEDGSQHVEDHYGNTTDKHATKESLGRPNTLSDTSIVYKDGITTMQFTMPLKTSDPNDPVLVQGEEVDIILARATTAKNDSTYHGSADTGGHYTVKVKL